MSQAGCLGLGLANVAGLRDTSPEVNGGTRLDFGILGPIEVRREGVAVRVGGPRQRALLALLLCNANRVVSRERLIDELLGDQVLETAEHALRVQVSRLRKALADDGDQQRLLTRAPGYQLRVEDGELDLHVFEQLLSDGRQALEHGDAGQAAGLLRESESLWRGRPLADLEFEPFAQFEVQRLEELRLLALEERIEAELAVGRHAALCPELESLVAEHPLRERFRGQLMLALYRSGRQADGLEVYRAGRLLLVEELALEPGPQLRQLERAILEQDPTLEPPRGSQPPVAVDTLVEEDVSEVADAKPAPRRPRPNRARWAALALGVCVAAALAGFAIAPDLGSSARRPRNGNVLALIPPGDRSVAATVRLRAPPTAVAAGFGSLWVAEAGAGLIIRVGEKRRAVLAEIPVGVQPGRMLAADGQVWVLDPVDRTLSAIDPDTDAVDQTIAVGRDPSDLVLSDGSLWVANQGDGTVTRLDPSTGRTQQIIRTGGDPTGLATTAGAVWVANDEAGTVDRIDAHTGAITSTIRIGDAPAAITAAHDALWVLDPLDATVSRVDPRRETLEATVSLGGAPTALTQSGGNVWVADSQRGTVLQVDPGSNTVKDAALVGGQPTGLEAADGLWVAAAAVRPSHRGGTLTTATSYQIIDTVDPAAGTSNNVSPPQFLGMTNDGLVTVDHAAGVSGTRLVPDLAISLPEPSDAGRSYTFRLRPGVRYSTGAMVRASDVTHSFERVFAIGSSGADWYRSILGAAACLRRPASCNLARGIVADNQTQTVTFHLTRPDPDFLYKLTLTFADVLPGSTPDSQARSPLPATGPYMISRYIPSHEVLLTRNPRFREWSAAAQPEGYPDRVLLRLDLDGSRSASAVATGAADFMANLGQIPDRYAAYFLRHHRRQVRVDPLMETSFMFLNTRAAPFNDIRVRRALNLALDRSRIVNSYGGTSAAQPTCQILPPGIPGYRPYCPYTSEPSADGRWQTPNMTEARRLVAASGTKAMKVTVWNTPGPPGTIAETKDAVTVLDQLGYRATLRLLPDTTYFTYTNDSRNHAQVIDGGWSADYGDADDFIGKLTCRYFIPRDGLDTADASEFCDPSLDNQVARANALQTTDPSAANGLWAQLDDKLTNLAIWVPTVTPNEIDLISRRVGHYQYNPVWGVLLDQLWVR
jgi:ABC-type transport system substrate-binding protein/DNA-binding SARP family transcriptional activator